MPRLGEPVEPARVEGATPWWRVVDSRAIDSPQTVAAETMTLPKAMPWPID
jgi:hypothetical protein